MSLESWIVKKKPIITEGVVFVEQQQTDVVELELESEQTTSVSQNEVEIENIEYVPPIKKTNLSNDGDRNFRQIWKEKYPWLTIGSDNNKICSVCESKFTGGASHIARHEESLRHIKLIKVAKFTPKISAFVKDLTPEIKSSRNLEITLALFVAEHNLAFSALDHLQKCLKSAIPDSKIITNFSINRKKGKNILTNIIAPENKKQIVTLTEKNYYSLIIDETTDVGSVKNLAVIVRVFDCDEVKDRFLGLIALTNTTAAGIYESLIEFLNQNKIKISNLISFTADNCAVMMGAKNGVQARLKELIPNIYIHGCICHNLSLIANVAHSQLPNIIDKVMHLINHHFCHSPNRKEHFAEFQESFGAPLHAILRLSVTRWLSRKAVVDRLLEQWSPLQYYFNLQNFDEAYGNENIKQISDALADHNIKVYFIFLSYVLEIINAVNVEMQCEGVQVHVYISKMKYLFNMIGRNLVSKQYLDNTSMKDMDFKNNHLPINDIYCGVQVEEFLIDKHFSNAEREIFLINVKNYYIKFCETFKRKINLEDLVLNFIPKFTPNAVVSGATNSVLPIVRTLFPVDEMVLAEKINNEYRALAELDDIKKFKDLCITEFWYKIGQIKNSLDEPMFSNISRIAKGLLSISHSSANVERVFSSLNLNKTLIRNRLKLNTVSSLLETKSLLKSSKADCSNYKFPTSVFKKNLNQSDSDSDSD